VHELRSIIRRLVLEAVQTAHYTDRVAERLLDPDRITPPLNRSVIEPLLDLLTRIDFPRGASVGVKLFQSGTVFKAFVSDKWEPSVGNTLWAVVRNNDLVTTMFSHEKYVPRDVQYVVSIAKLKRIVTEKGSYLITTSDLEDRPAHGARKRGGLMNLPVVVISGKEWYADVNKEVLYYAKNIHKTMTFNDAFSTLPETELDSILDQLSSVTN